MPRKSSTRKSTGRAGPKSGKRQKKNRYKKRDGLKDSTDIENVSADCKTCNRRSSVMGIVYLNGKVKHIRIDPCIRGLPWALSFVGGFHVVGCCCGHGRHPLSVICKNPNRKKNNYFDLISGVDIPRSKRFYFRDKEGYFFLPEVEENQKQIMGKK